MTKQEIFDKIAEISAEVCSVPTEDIFNGSKSKAVITARMLCIFWADAAGFEVESLLTCAELNSPNTINVIRQRQEEYWANKWAYHILVKEVGKRLLEYAHSIGEDFNALRPLAHIAKTTGMYPTNSL